MPVGEKERLHKLEKQRDKQDSGQVLEVPWEEAYNIAEDNPLEQLPGEGDLWYTRFLDFMQRGRGRTIVDWHRQAIPDKSLVHTQNMARMFLWNIRRKFMLQQEAEQASVTAKRQVYDTQVAQLRIADAYTEKLLLAGMSEKNGAKAQSLLKAAVGLQTNTLRNQAENQRNWTKFDTEMARIKAINSDGDNEDLD